MLPPSIPKKKDEKRGNMVGWKNPFNMRHETLSSLAASSLGVRNGVRSDWKAFSRAGCITCPVKSLDLVRMNLQSAINLEIEAIIKKYLDRFFKPAIKNIRNNQGKDSINDEHVKDVCRKILDECKQHLYGSSKTVTSEKSSRDNSNAENVAVNNKPANRKRKESDTDSEASSSTTIKRPKQRPPTGNVTINAPLPFGMTEVSYPGHGNTSNLILKLPLKREAPKWDPERINARTLFIMGAKANKVLGYGQTRGRLYVRHPELVRYSGDHEDKEWLTSKNLMPPSGGKAYLMILDDICELTNSDEYRNAPNLQMGELHGFEAPPFMIAKVRAFLEEVRTDKPPPLQQLQELELPLIEFDHQLHLPLIEQFEAQSSPSQKFEFFEFPIDAAVEHFTASLLDSDPSTPSDIIHLLNPHSISASTSSSKFSDDNFIHIPDISPGSNHSLLSTGALTHSPMSLHNSLLSPNMFINISTSDTGAIMVLSDAHASSCLSTLLSSHISNDNSDDFLS